jgi:thiosulfate/3-mercaptopyruvate sulfurtransferase
MCTRLVVAAAFALAFGPRAAPAQSGPSLLITPAELSANLGNPNLVILHVGARPDYDAGHIAGARFIQMQDVAAPRGAGTLSLELPDDSTLRRTLEGFGIGDRSLVVVTFGQDWVSPSTRIVWTLQAAGLGDRTRLLDGGTQAWRRAGLPVTTEVPSPARPGRLTIPANRSIVVDHRWIQARSNARGVRLIDARAPMFYEGPGMTSSRGNRQDAGHIAGAKNLPFNTLNDDSLQFLPVAELRRLFASAGVQPGDTVAAYCHIGQQATVVMFAARLLGHPIRLYDGSMNEWETLNLPLVNLTKPPAGNEPSWRSW